MRRRLDLYARTRGGAPTPHWEALECGAFSVAGHIGQPKGERPATWHWFALKGDEPRPLFAFPGLWRRWSGPLKKDGSVVNLDVCAFLTTLPNALVATVNHERMPVLLTQEDEFEAWLNGSPQEAFQLVQSYDAERMRIVQSGSDWEDLLGAAKPASTERSKARSASQGQAIS